MGIDISALEVRVRALEDWQRIHELELRYAHLLDTGRNHLVAQEIFTADAVLDFGTGHLEGREAIHGFYTGFGDAMLGTSHNLTNFHIEVQGDSAHSVCRSMAWHWFKATSREHTLPPSDILAIGGYEDELRRTSDGWRVAHRRSFQFGTGVGVGTAPAEIRPIFEGLMGRLPTWPK